MLHGYMDQLSEGWLCPGWPIDKPYGDASISETRGTPLDWLSLPPGGNSDSLPMVPNSPRNMGIGYDYKVYNGTWSIWDLGEPYSTPEQEQALMAKLRSMRNFDRVRYPEKSVVTHCLPMQQGAMGVLGPHNNNTRWDILWADGTISSVPSGTHEIYESSWGAWNRK